MLSLQKKNPFAAPRSAGRRPKDGAACRKTEGPAAFFPSLNRCRLAWRNVGSRHPESIKLHIDFQKNLKDQPSLLTADTDITAGSGTETCRSGLLSPIGPTLAGGECMFIPRRGMSAFSFRGFSSTQLKETHRD